MIRKSENDAAITECEHVREQLEEYVHAELTADEARVFDEHMRTCPECTSEHQVSMVLTEVILRGCREEAPEALKRRVVARLRTLHAEH
ncbi:anti-sigma factor family protein [Pseudoclavibacter sp. CFCC 11306]|uniref:anti-sigma factor family protein n=1 Tax=Pseudoclavibacter sp. CFCC 11306 TaxID=1564493 RepID=UPI001301162E|nr:zf-HC2 domain-containing protein [Pseudoclavibacter sp. CFCC 11306]KAB1658610.1 alpha-ketoglutarate decarboxylase [Pseudoclavibacter sp. CFCC 11306]